MALARIDFTFANNETWRRSFTVTRNGDPLNLTGATLRMAVAKPDQRADVVLHLKSGDGLSVVNAAGGEFQLVAAYNRVRAIPAGSYVYDLLIDLPDETLRPFAGTITVEQGITR